MAWKPINPFNPLPAADSPEEMRAAIEEAQRQHPLVRNILVMARMRGLKGEDVYAMLAYHALQQLTTVQGQLLEHLALSTKPLQVFVPADWTDPLKRST